MSKDVDELSLNGEDVAFVSPANAMMFLADDPGLVRNNGGDHVRPHL